MQPSIFPFILLIFISIFYGINSKCAFEVDDNMVPIKVDKPTHLVENMTLCKEYNGKQGCCNANSDKQQINSYQSIDGIFSSLGDGCDICAVNLKRFWCEYACSPEQASFVSVENGYFPVPNPTKPDQIVMAQKVNITINAQTACDLYSSCSRNAFVSSVSAMNTPAGFLSFLGANSINDASQMMTMLFTYSKNNSIYFGDDRQPMYNAMDNCNKTINQTSIHGFPVFKNCTCNNCATSCQVNQGFIYEQPFVLQGFNYVLVGSVWAAAIAIAFTVSTLKKKNISVDESGQEDEKKAI